MTLRPSRNIVEWRKLASRCNRGIQHPKHLYLYIERRQRSGGVCPATRFRGSGLRYTV
jgi:hypothetical protein